MSRQLFEYYSPDKANIIVESSNDGKDLHMSGLFIQGEVKNQLVAESKLGKLFLES